MGRLFGRRKTFTDPTAAVAAGQFDAAVEIYRRRISEDPDHAPGWMKKLAEVLALAGRRAEAVSTYLAAADAHARADRMVQAIALYRTILRLDPHNTDVHARLGEIAAEPAPAHPNTPPAPAPETNMTIRTRLRKMVPLFSGFDRDELTHIVQLMEPRHVAAGQLVFRQGDPGDSIFVIVQGEVALTVRGRDGQPVELERLTDGGFFGEMSAMRESPRNVTAVGVRSSDLLELSREYLAAVAITHPHVWEVLAEFQKNRVAPVGV